MVTSRDGGMTSEEVDDQRCRLGGTSASGTVLDQTYAEV